MSAPTPQHTDEERFLGAHMSIAGGLSLAVERIRSVSGTALQIFSRNQRQWKTPELTDEEIANFAAARRQWGAYPIAVHDSYLINLASPDHALQQKSITAFAAELVRCARLDVNMLVTHPGSHRGDGAEKGLARYVENLDTAISHADSSLADLAHASDVRILLETTAGQGAGLGGRFEELGYVMEHSAHAGRLGVCFDTCHVFSAGYDLRTKGAVAETLTRFDDALGLERMMLFHFNDSKEGLGARKDRHEHIGQGAIGLGGFRALLNDGRVQHIPGVLETPKEKDLEFDKKNLAQLRALLA